MNLAHIIATVFVIGIVVVPLYIIIKHKIDSDLCRQELLELETIVRPLREQIKTGDTWKYLYDRLLPQFKLFDKAPTEQQAVTIMDKIEWELGNINKALLVISPEEHQAAEGFLEEVDNLHM